MTTFQIQIAVIGHGNDNLNEVFLDPVVGLGQQQTETGYDDLLLVGHLLWTGVDDVLKNDQCTYPHSLVVLLELLEQKWQNSLAESDG